MTIETPNGTVVGMIPEALLPKTEPEAKAETIPVVKRTRKPKE